MSEYHIREYQPGDEVEIAELLVTAFKGWPKFDLDCSPLDHWRWKYIDNPLKTNSVLVAVSDSHIVGCICGYYFKILVNGENLLGQHGGDLAVHPDYRKSGIFSELRLQKYELLSNTDTKLSFFLSTNPIVIESMKKRVRVNDFPHALTGMVRIKDFDMQLEKMPIENSLVNKYGFLSLKTLSNIRNRIMKQPDIGSNVFIKKISAFDERVDEFWKEVNDNHDFIFERSREYLNWRYCDSRAGKFIVEQAEEDGKILGYIVYNINRIRSDYPVGSIIDILTLPKRLDIAQALVKNAVDFFDEQDINLIKYINIEKNPNEIALKNNGFLDSRWNKYGFFYTPYGGEDKLSEPLAANRFHFTFGDTDSG